MRTKTIASLVGLAMLAGGAPQASARPGTDSAPLPDTSALTYTNLPAATRTLPRDTQSPKFGPPPPGYSRIVGGAAPSWDAADMLADRSIANPWLLLGPQPIAEEFWSGRDNASGRIVSIAPHPTDPDTVYIASASGGVWKTVDGGAHWVPLTDELPTLNHGAVAVDPSNPETVYVGTGEWTVGSIGAGLFRTTDGGATWERRAPAATVGQTCSRIVVDPTNPQRVHLTGGLGYLRSDDAGRHWTMRLPGSASDVALNPLNPQQVFVGRYGDGVYRSDDGGDTFEQLTSGLAASDVRRILVAVAPSDPRVVYTVFVNSDSGLRGLYRSGDGGDTWQVRNNTPNFPTPQGWYDLFLIVDPADADTVFGGGVFPTYGDGGIVKTVDGGVSWQDITIDTWGNQVHPDEQAAAFGPDGTLWVGNDGGMWKMPAGGDAWINLNATLTVTQNYQIALHPADPNQMMGGTQDNGTIGREDDGLSWPQVRGGDGGFLAYDFVDPSTRYFTYVYLTIYRETNGHQVRISDSWGMDEKPFIAPLVMDPNDPHTLLGGTERVWRTTNAHAEADWTAISPASISGGGTLTAIAIAPSDSSVVYTGATTGRIYVTTDLATWQSRTPPLGMGEISDIVIDPTDAAVAYASTYRDSGVRVARTDDFGVTWRSVTGDLPGGVSGTALAVDWRLAPPTLYLGTGAGVWESHDGGAMWVKDGTDLPNVNVGDLRMDFPNGTITAGTYGRGTWRKNALRDCNNNGIADDQDVAAGTAADCNGNGVPDECEIAGDTSALRQWAGGSSHASAQSYEDAGFPAYSIKLWDDFTLVREARLITGRAFFRPADWLGFGHVPFLVEIADAPGGAEAGANVLHTTYAASSAGEVTWDFQGVIMPPGTYWISVQALGGATTYGMVQWWRSNDADPRGSEHYVHNPGGGLGLGPDPVPASVWLGVPADLSIVQDAIQELDCNGNGVLDACEIADGTCSDLNGNGLPDTCDLPGACPGDANCDGVVTWRDIAYFQAAVLDGPAGWEALFGPETPACPFENNDANGDGVVSGRDIDPFVNVMNTTCP